MWTDGSARMPSYRKVAGAITFMVEAVCSVTKGTPGHRLPVTPLVVVTKASGMPQTITPFCTQTVSVMVTFAIHPSGSEPPKTQPRASPDPDERAAGAVHTPTGGGPGGTGAGVGGGAGGAGAGGAAVGGAGVGAGLAVGTGDGLGEAVLLARGERTGRALDGSAMAAVGSGGVGESDEAGGVGGATCAAQAVIPATITPASSSSLMIALSKAGSLHGAIGARHFSRGAQLVAADWRARPHRTTSRQGRAARMIVERLRS